MDNKHIVVRLDRDVAIELKSHGRTYNQGLQNIRLETEQLKKVIEDQKIIIERFDKMLALIEKPNVSKTVTFGQ